ncbi:MAG: YceD family protein [Sphingomicrobium sp.]
MSESFTHELRLDQIRDGDRIDLTASDSERPAIAGDLGLEALGRLDAHAMFERKGDVVRVTGRILASLTQACVVTGDPVSAHVDEPFDLLFTPAAPDGEADSEIELGPEDCDTIFHDGATIDLGRAILDTLALGIDPYPRSAGADAALKGAGIMTEAETGPFAALAALRKGRESAD